MKQNRMMVMPEEREVFGLMVECGACHNQRMVRFDERNIYSLQWDLHCPKCSSDPERKPFWTEFWKNSEPIPQGLYLKTRANGGMELEIIGRNEATVIKRKSKSVPRRMHRRNAR